MERTGQRPSPAHNRRARAEEAARGVGSWVEGTAGPGDKGSSVVTIRAGKQARAARWAAQRYQTLWPLRESNPKRPFGPRILKPRGQIEDTRDIEKTSPIGDPSQPETAPLDHAVGQSRGNEPTDAELERGILDAVKMGLADVARTLAAQLEARQRARAGNVVALDPSKRRGR